MPSCFSTCLSVLRDCDGLLLVNFNFLLKMENGHHSMFGKPFRSFGDNKLNRKFYRYQLLLFMINIVLLIYVD